MEALKYNFNSKFGDYIFTETYIRSYKEFSIHRVSWMPKKDPKVIILLVHDLGDHVSRFHSLAQYFTQEDIGVVGIDLRGHGKSEGRRGGASYNELLSDVSELVKSTQKKHPYTPKIFYGHGMGANLIMNYSIHHPNVINGIIASAPWMKSHYTPSPFIQLSSKLFVIMYPIFTISNGIQSRYLSHDFSVVTGYNEDSLVHDRVSPRLFYEASDAGRYILKNKHKFNVPLLLMHGTSDKITSWHATAEFAKYTNTKNTTFKSWEGAYHELHNEFDKEKIFDYILHWINNLSSVQHVIYGSI